MKTCFVKDCDGKPEALGLCHFHYNRQWKGIEFNKPKRKLQGRSVCTVDSCGNFVTSGGLCATHVSRKKKGIPLDAPKWLVKPRLLCSVEGCTRMGAPSHGMCNVHHQRKGFNREMNAPIRKRKPFCRKGEWYKNADGYMMRGLTRQHRQVMEEKIKRKLRKGENVHHINGIRDDNRPENLELWSKAQPYGQRIEDKVKFAREILADYGEMYPERLQ